MLIGEEGQEAASASEGRSAPVRNAPLYEKGKVQIQTEPFEKSLVLFARVKKVAD